VFRELKELWKFRELLSMMVRRELSIRYKNSFLGFLWSLVNPMVTVVVMTVVFKYVWSVKIESYSAYILAAYLPFTFFQMSLMDASQSIVSSLTLIKKIYFPREILPLALIISNFIHFVLALGVFFAFLLSAFLRNPKYIPFQPTLIYLPLLLIINFVLATGLGLLISSLNVFYEDIKYIISIILYLLFFLCPVMYFSEQIKYSPGLKDHPWVYFVYHLNPVAMMVTAYRKVLVASQPVEYGGVKYDAIALDWGLLGITALSSFLILWYGYRTFNRLKWRFVERI
jgi:lipopolysaccharide transport system permease protein